MGSDQDCSYFIQRYRTLGCCLLQGHHPANSQVLWDVALVQCVQYLVRDLVAQGLVRMKDIPIKTIGSQPFVEVAAFDGLRDVCEFEDLRRGVDHHCFFLLYLHILIIF